MERAGSAPIVGLAKAPDSSVGLPVADEAITVQANYAVSWFAYTLILKKTHPIGGQEIDVAVKENRDGIRESLCELIRERLGGSSAATEIEERLLATGQSGEALAQAAHRSALAIHYIDAIAKAHADSKSRYLREVVDDLVKNACTGAAQTIGPVLPLEVVETWPHFARLFERAKDSAVWPPDV